MAVTTGTMTDEQRKSVALEYLKRLDRGEDFFDLFAADAQLYFPKCPLANGIDAIKQTFGHVASIVSSVTHDYATFNYIISGDLVVVEGTSSGTTPDGTPWRAGVTHAGRWCDVFEVRDGLIQRLFVYLDPDYADADKARYPWLRAAEGQPAATGARS